MKKVTNLIALVMLVSTNVLTPFSYAQDVLSEVNPENEVETLGESGGITENEEQIKENDLGKGLIETDDNVQNSSEESQKNELENEVEEVQEPQTENGTVIEGQDSIQRENEDEVGGEDDGNNSQDSKSDKEQKREGEDDDLSDLTISNLSAPVQDDSTLTVSEVGHNKDIIIQATATAANQTLKINKYFANAYTVDWGDGSEVVNLTADTTHTYSEAGTYTITLSTTADRWTFQSVSKPLVPTNGTTATDVKITYMPSLEEGFGTNATNPGNYFFYYFNSYGALTSLPEGSFDTSNITTAGTHFFPSFNSNGALTNLPEGSFDTSNIETAGDNFFSSFNYNGALTSLPEGSFDMGKVKTKGNMFLYNFWGEGEARRVVFDCRGGGCVSSIVVDNTSFVILPNAQKVGYTFLGRYTQSEGGEMVGGYNDIYPTVKDVILYAHRSPREEGDMNTITMDSVDGGKITIMDEDIGIVNNDGWNERDQGPCQAGYHVPTMQEWNTLFVSWCENHTKLNDGICDVRNLDRDVWEEGMKDFIYKPKDESVLDSFAEELNLEVGFKGVEICDEDEYGEYCYTVPEQGGMKDLVAYRTSNPYIVGNERSMSWYYMLSSFYDAVNRTQLNGWKLNVRCFKDDYTAPSRMVLVDIIDEDKLEEYKQIEEKYRSGEEELPEDELMEIAFTELFLGSQSRESLKIQLQAILIPSLEEKYNCENCSELPQEKRQHYIDLQDLVESVVSVDEEDYDFELIDRVYDFGWIEPDDSIDCWGEDITSAEELYCEDYENEKYIKSYLLFVLGEIDSIPGISEADLVQEIENIKQMFYTWIDTDYDFFSEEERQNLKRHIDELENYDVSSAIDMLKSVNQEIHDLMQNYPDEPGRRFWFLPSWELVSWTLDMIKFAAEFADANKLIGEEFVNESKIYLGTDDWIRGDGTIDVKEMVLQEFLQNIFSQMGYRVIVTPEMTAKEIRNKIADIKGVSLEDDEYLALFDVKGNEINIDGGVKQNNRGYIGVKKMPIVSEKEPEKEPEESGGKGGGYSGGGSSSKTHEEEKKPEKKSDKDIQSETKPAQLSGVKSEESSETPMDSSPSVQNDNNTGGQSNSQEYSNYSPEFISAYQFAFKNKITTVDSINRAKLDGNLTRIQMAKMLSYYAINVLGQTLDETRVNKFRDVSEKLNADYNNAVTLAYQLGIMGINMPRNEFRPYDLVPRSEFVTALSRMIYDDVPDGKNAKFYEPHMAKLYNEGIISNTNPKMIERRGYVMLMLMRSAK